MQALRRHDMDFDQVTQGFQRHCAGADMVSLRKANSATASATFASAFAARASASEAFASDAASALQYIFGRSREVAV